MAGYLLTSAIFIIAILYSSVGHAGASGYIAAMALAGVAPEIMKPAALIMNILVATIATTRFYRAGCFSWSIFWPFAVASIPLAFAGGSIVLPGLWYRQIVGAVLLFAAVRLLISTQKQLDQPARKLPIAGAIVCGGCIGFLAGLTGTGGGIFLSPLLLLFRWSETRQSLGVSAAFVLVNSVAGLLGHLASLNVLPSSAFPWAVAAAAGGVIGSELGSRRLKTLTLRRLLGVVLVVAGLKLMLT